MFLVVELVPCPTPIEPWVNPELHTHTMVPSMVKSRNREIIEVKYPILRLNQKP